MVELKAGALKNFQQKDLFKVCLGDVVDRVKWLVFLLIIFLNKASDRYLPLPLLFSFFLSLCSSIHEDLLFLVLFCLYVNFSS
jgi:hypothetical protein